MIMATMATRLHVSGITPETTELELSTRFEHFGNVSSCVIVREGVSPDGSYDPATPGRGFGYVTLDAGSDELLNACLATYRNVRWRGREMRVDHAHEHYLDRIAREKEEAERATESAGEDEGGEEEPRHQQTELHIRGHKLTQRAVISTDPGRLPNSRQKIAEDEPLKPRSAIDWSPLPDNDGQTAGLGGTAPTMRGHQGQLRETRKLSVGRLKGALLTHRRFSRLLASVLRLRRQRRRQRLRGSGNSFRSTMRGAKTALASLERFPNGDEDWSTTEL
mmetsp:Transcript_5217/g.15495  ORF Transcript_5217/g.15495 Transcript_5217/m.15495 type:complete len:278 (-) Transcript_5217:146-979(-)